MNIHKPNLAAAAPAPRRGAPTEAAKPAEAAKPGPAVDAFRGTPDSYVIRPGDTLGKIASRFGVSPETLLELNPELTRGRKRTSTGDRIFAGETIRLKPAPSEADGLKDQLKQAKEAQAAAQQIAGAKIGLLQQPQPGAWRSLDEAKKHLADADARLAKIPLDDPERPTFEAIVKGAREAYEGMTGRLADLAARPKTKVVEEPGDDGKPVAREVDRELDDETLALGATEVALALPEQKAKLIRNLYDGFTGGDEQDKILAILADAKGQGQLEKTLDALKAETTKTLFIKSTVFENLPGLFTDARLDKLEGIVKGNAELEASIASTREARERRNAGY